MNPAEETRDDVRPILWIGLSRWGEKSRVDADARQSGSLARERIGEKRFWRLH